MASSTSRSFEFPHTTSSFATPTNTGSSDNGPPGSSSLYLFTFLTTLLLLLAVSCGIVTRSFILRRRFRQRVEAAIAAGVLLPEQVEALRRRGPNIGDKPRLWEVYIDGGHKAGYEPSSTVRYNEKLTDDWSGIMPVSATIIPGAQSSQASDAAAPPTVQFQRFSAQPANPRRRLWWLRGPDPNPTRLSPILPVVAPPPTPPNTQSFPMTTPMPSFNQHNLANPNDDKLQVTVLIAMPNRHVRTPASPASLKGKERDSTDLDDDEEAEIPEVVFGVTEVPWAGGADWIPTMDRKADEDEEKGGEEPPLR